MEKQHFPDTTALIQALTEDWLAYGGQVLQQRGQVHLALSARTATLEFLRTLSRSEWPWSVTYLYLAEEFWVPRHYPTSHYRQVYEACHPHRVSLQGWETETIDPALSASRFEKILLRQLGKPPRLDLALLEAGPAGQWGPIYPGSPAALAEDRFAIDQENISLGRRQLSLTLPSFQQARELWLIAKDPEPVDLPEDDEASEPPASEPSVILAGCPHCRTFVVGR